MQSISHMMMVKMRRDGKADLLSKSKQAIWLNGKVIPGRSAIHKQAAANRVAAVRENIAAANSITNKTLKHRRAVSASNTLPPEHRMINDEERQQLVEFHADPVHFNSPPAPKRMKKGALKPLMKQFNVGRAPDAKYRRRFTSCSHLIKTFSVMAANDKKAAAVRATWEEEEEESSAAAASVAASPAASSSAASPAARSVELATDESEVIIYETDEEEEEEDESDPSMDSESSDDPSQAQLFAINRPRRASRSESVRYQDVSNSDEDEDAGPASAPTKKKHHRRTESEEEAPRKKKKQKGCAPEAKTRKGHDESSDDEWMEDEAPSFVSAPSSAPPAAAASSSSAPPPAASTSAPMTDAMDPLMAWLAELELDEVWKAPVFHSEPEEDEPKNALKFAPDQTERERREASRYLPS
jgi:hypothetical protein